MSTTVLLTQSELNARDALRAPAEQFLGGNPGQDSAKINDKAQRFTANLRKEAERRIRAVRADLPVTILNMNCGELKINGGVYFPDAVPRCPVGKPYAVHTIRDSRWGHKDLGCDAQGMMQMEPVPAIPLALAAEYLREFGSSKGGVMCYLGADHPSTFKKGHKVQVPEVAYTPEGEFYVELRELDFHEELARVRDERNKVILQELQKANSHYENDGQRPLVNDTHRDMARLAMEEGLIPELPRWVMQANMTTEKQPDPCPQCVTIPKAGAIICVNCFHVFDVVAAYKNTRIAYGAVEMDRLTADEWKVVNQIKAERDRARGIKAQ